MRSIVDYITVFNYFLNCLFLPALVGKEENGTATVTHIHILPGSSREF